LYCARFPATSINVNDWLIGKLAFQSLRTFGFRPPGHAFQ
jgi:hypothetical protein